MIPNGLAEIKRFFGDPSRNRKKWERDNLVRVALPFDMALDWAEGSIVDCTYIHKNVADDFVRRWGLVWEHAKTHAKNVNGWMQSETFIEHKALEWLHEQGLTRWGGCYNNRNKRSNSNELSVHAYGGAWDIDCQHNKQGTVGRMQKWFVDIWTAPDDNGDHWIWGGTFKKRDDMHFQFCKGY